MVLPSETSHNQDYWVIESLRTGFEKYSAVYRVERPAISGCIGDLKIVHIPTWETVFVELKRSCCEVQSPGTIRHYASFPLTKKRRRPRANPLYFTSTTSWDFLLTVLKSSSKDRLNALFFSRDDLPQDWFNRTPEKNQHTWAAGKATVHGTLGSGAPPQYGAGNGSSTRRAFVGQWPPRHKGAALLRTSGGRRGSIVQSCRR